MKDRILIYEIQREYLQYLSQYNEHIFYQTNDKTNRKYIGIVFEINKTPYFAPLSSFKVKHKKISNSVDLIKIKDYAVINLNNMISVPKNQLISININTVKDKHYKYLLQAESREINNQKNRIRRNAGIVYNHKLLKGNSTALAKRTNDFKVLEKLYKDFN